jgi:hypothetical protein
MSSNNRISNLIRNRIAQIRESGKLSIGIAVEAEPETPPPSPYSRTINLIRLHGMALQSLANLCPGRGCIAVNAQFVDNRTQILAGGGADATILALLKPTLKWD